MILNHARLPVPPHPLYFSITYKVDQNLVYLLTNFFTIFG